ncbi:MAG TPA: hypothetical protein VKE94_14675 [Gemmataceae bacterium]|nr:hypothetical protein [Gemmataceae bacterium]
MAGQEVLSDNNSVPLPFPASTAIARGDLLYWDTAAFVCKPASAFTPQANEAADQAAFAPLFVGVAQDVRLASEADNKGIRTVRVSGVFDFDTVAGYTPKLGDKVSVTRDGGSTLVNQKLTNTGVTGTSMIGIVIGLPTQAANTVPWNTVQTRVRVKLNGRLTDFP